MCGGVIGAHASNSRLSVSGTRRFRLVSSMSRRRGKERKVLKSLSAKACRDVRPALRIYCMMGEGNSCGALRRAHVQANLCHRARDIHRTAKGEPQTTSR
eukprot:4777225-Pleurochrysis_carterae.AAC.2